MNVKELIEMLEDFKPGSEVRIMTQQSWPFENTVHGVASSLEMSVPDEDEDEDEQEIIYIVEGSQIGYGNKDAWEAARK